VFKQSDVRNTNIEGDTKRGHTISDFSAYFYKGKFSGKWAIPNKFKPGDFSLPSKRERLYKL